MPERSTRFNSIANQMMKGCTAKIKANNVAGTQEEIEDFRRVYENTINYIEQKIPKNVSVGVCGAIGKAVLWYGKEAMEPFIHRFVSREFEGRDDPCHALWEWLIRYNKRNNTKEIYRRTVAAIRIHLRNGKSNGYLKPALDDLFEWQDNYRKMCQPKRNQYSDVSSKSEVKQADEAVEADVEDLLNGCRT